MKMLPLRSQKLNQIPNNKASEKLRTKDNPTNVAPRDLIILHDQLKDQILGKNY